MAKLAVLSLSSVIVSIIRQDIFRWLPISISRAYRISFSVLSCIIYSSRDISLSLKDIFITHFRIRLSIFLNTFWLLFIALNYYFGPPMASNGHSRPVYRIQISHCTGFISLSRFTSYFSEYLCTSRWYIIFGDDYYLIFWGRFLFFDRFLSIDIYII